MESMVKSDTFMKIYNQVHKINPEPSPVISDIVQSIATSSAPVSPSGGSNGNLGKTILIVGLICLACYGGYKWYNYIQEKKDKRVR
jgi:hypothetical protein